MTVVKQYNPITLTWDPVAVGSTGPRGPVGPPGESTTPWIDLAGYGAKYDGTDDSQAFRDAILDVEPFSHVHISGPLALGSPVICNKVITLTGEGLQSPIYPLPGFTPGEFLLTFQFQNKGWEGEDNSHLARIVCDNLAFDGVQRTIPCGGLKLFTIQESWFSRLRFHNIKGRAMWAYRSVRDSIFHTIYARQCADFDTGAAQFDWGETVLGSTQDSNNNLMFIGLFSHVAAGDLMSIESADPDTSAMRVFMFVNCKFHGVWTPGATLQGIPLGYWNSNRVRIRNVKGVFFTNSRFHCAAPGFPLIHVGPYPTQPGSLSNTSVDLSQLSIGNTGNASSMLLSFNAGAGGTLTSAVTQHFATGMMVRANTSTISGIATLTDYFVIRVDATTIKLADTFQHAEAGTAITSGATGSVDIETQGMRIFIDAGTYGEVREGAGVDYDGPANRKAVVSKSHLQVYRHFASMNVFADCYEGVIDEAKLEQHYNIGIDGVLDHDGTKVGFYGTTPIVKPTGVTPGAALEALGLGASLVASAGGGDTFSSEWLPPLAARSIGMMWLVPSVGHMAIWSMGPTGAAWFPVAPANPEQNICAILAGTDYLNEMENWDGITGSAKWVNEGDDNVTMTGATPNVNVVQATDASGRKHAVMNSTNTDAIVGGGASMRDILAGDSFSVWCVKSQAAFVANTNLFTTRSAPTTATVAGWGLGGGNATTGIQAMRISDGTTLVEAISATVPVNQIKLVLGIRNVATDTVEIHTGTDAGVSVPDTTTGSLVALDVPRISRAAGSGTGRTAMNLYMAAWTRRAYTATEVVTLKTWAAARFA